MGATGTEPTRNSLVGAVLFVQSLKGLSHLERSVLLTVIAFSVTTTNRAKVIIVIYGGSKARMNSNHLNV